MQEERAGRAMRRTRDEHHRRPARRSRERAPFYSRRLVQPTQYADTEVSQFTPSTAWLADHRPRSQDSSYVATAELCKNFLRHTLRSASSDSTRRSASTSSKYGVATVHEFIGAVLRTTHFHECIAFSALFLLHRLRHSGVPLDADKACILFLGAYMISAKMYEDTNFRNTYWVVMGDRSIRKDDVDQCERDLCRLLHWNLRVDPVVLNEFAQAVKRDFQGDGPYPDYGLDEDLFDPEKRFPRLPGNPVEEDEEEILVTKSAPIPPAAICATLARHRKPVEDKPLPPLPNGHRVMACEGSATTHARSKAGSCLDNPAYPTCRGSSTTWLPPVVPRVPGHQHLQPCLRG